MSTTITRDEWLDKATRLFGDNLENWKFICPTCSTVQTVRDFLERTNLERENITNVIGFSCIGRWAAGGCERAGLNTEHQEPKSKEAMGCNYAGGGLFQLNPVVIEFEGAEYRRFAFAEEES